MIHSVKDFVDKKMNNKLICFNNVLDDYLFFYDKTKKRMITMIYSVIILLFI